MKRKITDFFGVPLAFSLISCRRPPPPPPPPGISGPVTVSSPSIQAGNTTPPYSTLKCKPWIPKQEH